MSKHCYRIAYERLSEGLRQAERSEDCEWLARAQAELDVFVGAMVTDPRKLRAVAQDSPACAQEIIARAEELDLPGAGLIPAVTYVANRACRLFVDRLEPEQAAATIARGVGQMGANRDYLLNTLEHLRAMGVRDAGLSRIASLLPKPA